MLVHQDASSHEWIAGHSWDLVVTYTQFGRALAQLGIEHIAADLKIGHLNLLLHTKCL